MTRAKGSGWHCETRRHVEAARKGRDHSNAHIVQEARRNGYARTISKKGRQPRSYRQRMSSTPASAMEPCLMCGAPTLPGRTSCQRCDHDQEKYAGRKKGYSPRRYDEL